MKLVPDRFDAANPDDPIAAELDRAASRGQRLTPWIRFAMRAWERRNPVMPTTGKGNRNPKRVTCLEAGFVPIPCDCVKCKTPALIFPPEDGQPWMEHGVCICPNCSLPKSEGAVA